MMNFIAGFKHKSGNLPSTMVADAQLLLKKSSPATRSY